jgi:hypothetical protein
MYGLPGPITPAQRKALLDGLDDEKFLGQVHPRTLAALRRAGLVETNPCRVKYGIIEYDHTLTDAGKAAAQSLRGSNPTAP